MKGERRLLRPGKRVVHMPLLFRPQDDAVAECLVKQQAVCLERGHAQSPHHLAAQFVASQPLTACQGTTKHQTDVWMRLGLRGGLRCAHLNGQAALINGEIQRVHNVVLAGVLLRQDERPAGHQLLALVHLEGLVCQLRADGSAQGAVFSRLVLVDDADDAAACLLGHLHQPLGHLVGQLAVVDVVHQVAHAVENYQVGVAKVYRSHQQRQPLLPRLRADIEDVVRLFGECSVVGAYHRYQAVPKDVLRALVALLSIEPQHL